MSRCSHYFGVSRSRGDDAIEGQRVTSQSQCMCDMIMFVWAHMFKKVYNIMCLQDRFSLESRIEKWGRRLIH